MILLTVIHFFPQVTKSVLALLKYYNWRKFSIIFQEHSQWEAIAEYLQNQAQNNDFKFIINHFKSFKGIATYPLYINEDVLCYYTISFLLFCQRYFL